MMGDVSLGMIILSGCMFFSLVAGLFLVVLMQATKLPPRR
jgi:hypothetical protein